MEITDTLPGSKKGWMKIMASLALLAVGAAAQAQEGSQGNATVFAGAQATFFGNHSFVAPSATPGTLAGIINTERTTSATGTGYGVVNYAAASLVVTGADDANHVDGYVRNLGAGLFVYPVGDNGFYGPFAATGAGTTGAYFHTDATTAITSNLGGGNYPILPVTGSGLAFPTTSKAATLGTVSTVEYWDIDGAGASKITLTWDAGSNVTALTTSTLSRLTIVGWNPATSQWVKINSAVDPTSVLGGTSDLSAGSITTKSNLIPNTYTIYTLASAIPDLAPSISINPPQVVGDNKNIDVRIVVAEVNNVETSGNIFVRIPVSTHFTVNAYSSSLTTSVSQAVQNNQWTYLGISAGNHLFRYGGTAGVTSILGFGDSSFGISITFSANGQAGRQTLVASVFDGSGGEKNFLNNNDNEQINYTIN